MKNSLIFADLTPYLFWISKRQRKAIKNVKKKIIQDEK